MAIHQLRIFFLILLNFVFSLPESKAQPTKIDPPVINWVSLKNGTDNVQINWTLSTTSTVVSYIIRRPYPISLGGWAGWVSIDTSFSSTLDTFTFIYLPVLSDSVSFRMWAVNDSGQTSVLSLPVHTLNFLKVTPDTCNYTMHLNWTGYFGWGNSLDHYQVWVKPGDSVYTTTTAGVDSAVFLKPKSDSSYCFIIKAVNKNGTISNSNQQCAALHIPKVPAYINADYGSDVSGGIGLSFSFDNTSEIHTYELWRREGDTGLFSPIQTFINVKNGTIDFTDTKASPLIQYNYRLTAWNECDYAVQVSNLAGNIVLHDTLEGNQILLNWNPYIWWMGGAGNDTIMRSTPDAGWEFAAALSPADTSFSDNLDSLAHRNYKYSICYYIKASEDGVNPAGTKGYSISNMVCAPSPVAVKIPNAFTPNPGKGNNDKFMPVFDFEPEQYLLKIFDRNGNILFQTTNVSDSWNGTDTKGRYVPQGTYVYFIRYGSQNQPTRELRGMISVLYP